MVDRIQGGAVGGVGQVGTEPTEVKKPHLQALLSARVAERTNLLQENVRDFISQIEESNQQLANVQDLSSKLGHSDTINLSEEDRNLARSMGIDVPAGPLNKAGQKSLKEKLEAKGEALANTSQLQTVKLQSNMNKHNQSFELLSNFTNKWFNTLNNIVNNLK
ncbi:hypothetical protein ACWJJH_17265 [Endozoicomonadaceae bacterium StTr2]